MAWKETNAMNERVRFISKYLEEEETFSELCEMFGVSRKTGYKWVDRYREGGVEGLKDQVRAPWTHPNRMSEEVEQRLLEVRKKHPLWGPRKLLVVVGRQDPELFLPAASTVGEMLRRNGCTRKRKRNRKSSPYAYPLRRYESPNSVWCVDFKGHFPTGTERCHPLTISDGYSRYLLTCYGQKRPLYEQTRKVFERTFQEYGLPETIRSDNGAPFSTLAPGGLSRLSIWWVRLGILPERIMPGRPEQNGRHERMHSTLKAETAKPPQSSIRLQQVAFDRFRKEYNEERPHEGIGLKVPASLYVPSPRAYPKKLPHPEYPKHFRVERAYPNGVISFQQTQWYLSGCLRGEFVGLEEVGDDRWKVYFGPLALGIIDLHSAKARGDRHFGALVRADGGVTKDGRRKPYRKR